MKLTESQAIIILSAASEQVRTSSGLLKDLVSAHALTGMQLILARGLLVQVLELLTTITQMDTLFSLGSAPPPASAPAPCEADE